MPQPSQIIFLPGASGRVEFWHPLAHALNVPAEQVFFSYPGFGGVPDDASVHGLDDIVDRLLSHVDQPTALVAQSMGGVVAVMAALRRPELITHLVLTVTSGGLDMASFGARDWRSDCLATNVFPSWFVLFSADMSDQLHQIQAQTLLLWGDSDPYSPVPVGERLASMIRHAQLHVIAEGDHDLGNTHVSVIAPLVNAHLNNRGKSPDL